MKKTRKLFGAIALGILFIISMTAIFYPFLSNMMFEKRQDDLLEIYEQEILDSDCEQDFLAAEKYNKDIATGKVELQDPFAEQYTNENEELYHSILRINGTDMMAFIEIPRISVRIPVYHGTSAEVLEKGVGHLEGTSFPIGGNSTHAVLTGHTGLSNARLFTDLTKLQEGDLFFVTVYDRKLAYVVDQIKIVEPYDTSDLTIVENEDYCTLVTCTPYGVNSHRLLVRGTRTEYIEAMEEEIEPIDSGETQWMMQYRQSIVIGFGVMVAIFVSYWLFDRIRNARKKKVQEWYE